MLSHGRPRFGEPLRAWSLILLEHAHDLRARGGEALRAAVPGHVRGRLRASWDAQIVRTARRAAPWTISAFAAITLVLLTGTSVLASRRGPSLQLLPLAPDDCPSRLYAQSRSLTPGDPLQLRQLAVELEAGQYRLAERRITPGTYWFSPGHLVVGLREYPVPAGETHYRGGQRLDVLTRDGRIDRVLLDGRPAADPVPLDPPLLASVPDQSMVDCRPIREDRLPEYVVHAVMAAEDDDFYAHGGVSLAGILRAAWVNLTSGEVRQGGSTITQQLVKNLYLTPERSFRRKAEEALLALALETRHSKEEILTSYLNHAYWGQRGNAELVGIGAAARAWLGKDAAELSVPEAALLAAMIRSPGRYDPLRFPVRTRARRDWVLRGMHANGWIDDGTLRKALASPLRVAQAPPVGLMAPHFVRWVRAEVARRFGIELAGGGLSVLTTLRLDDQRHAQEVVAHWLPRLDRRDSRLETALVSLEPTSGALLAYVGGRSWSDSRFDRVSQARRQLGSAFKPVVYAAAMEHGVAFAGDVVDDLPMMVGYGDEYWLPDNSDGTHHGPVPVHRALERSLNVPTVRIALATGLEQIRDAAAYLKLLPPRTEAVPSLALGTALVTPLEVARAYATFAADGKMPRTHGVVAVYDSEGNRERDSQPPEATPILNPHTAFLMTRMLQGVIRQGTGYGVRTAGLRDPLAGKTGTSDEQRDAWFAGYAPERVTVVWVGRDDDRPTGYYGAQAALPIWTDFMRDVRPEDGFGDWEPPEDVVDVAIDPTTGQRATRWCPTTTTATYPVGHEPEGRCQRHGFDRAATDSHRDVIDAILRPDRGWLTAPVAYIPEQDHGTRPRNWRQRTRFVDIALAGDDDPWTHFQRVLARLRPHSVLVGEARLYEIPTTLRLPCVDRGQASIEGDVCAAGRVDAEVSG